MYIFVDESGDAAWPGSKNYFVLLGVILTDQAVEGMEAAVRAARLELRRPEGHEFKFTKMRHSDRLTFLEHVGRVDFRFTACSIDKLRVPPALQKQPGYVFEQVVAGLAGTSEPYLHACDEKAKLPLRTILIHDAQQDRLYLKQLQKRFGGIHSKDGRKMLKKLKAGDSGRSNLLQLADILCGVVRPDVAGYWDLVSHKSLGLLRLP